MACKFSDFTVEAPHSTDIWRKVPHTNRFDAPCKLQPSFPFNQFSSARVTFKGTWEYRYDQAGIVVCFSGQDPNSPDYTDPSKNSWIKAGIEFYKNAPHISFVGCDRFADWSLHPVERNQSENATADYVTIELRRQGDENGYALWAYQLVLDERGQVLEEFPIRECAWPFANPNCTVQIGAYAARPAPDTASTNKKLIAHFRDLEICTI